MDSNSSILSTLDLSPPTPGHASAFRGNKEPTPPPAFTTRVKSNNTSLGLGLATDRRQVNTLCHRTAGVGGNVSQPVPRGSYSKLLMGYILWQDGWERGMACWRLYTGLATSDKTASLQHDNAQHCVVIYGSGFNTDTQDYAPTHPPTTKKIEETVF